MKKKGLALLLCLFVAAWLPACSPQGGPATTPSGAMQPGESASPETGEGALQVIVTFNALQEFAKAVGKEKVEVTTIIPDGSEPHDFEPKARDLVALSSADVFVYNGLGMEAWAEEAVQAAGNAALIVVEASKGADWIDRSEEETSGAHGEEAESGAYDPHVWLSLEGAAVEVGNICDALVQADPANRAYYEANRDDYVAQLQSLRDDYAEEFASTARKSFVTGHAAFGYLCREFGLTQASVQDLYAEGEPSAQQLGELVDYCRQNGVTTIFAEEMASPEVSKTLADEVGVGVQTIYTMESAEDGLSYLRRMEENLSRIYDSLK